MKKAFLSMIRFYQKKISPLFPPRCRFYPTCSQYAVEAIERFGACKGGALALWRLLRCNPLFPGGYDPVPPKKKIFSLIKLIKNHINFKIDIMPFICCGMIFSN